MVERDKINTPSTQIHDFPLSWLVTGTSIKSGGKKINKKINIYVWGKKFEDTKGIIRSHNSKDRQNRQKDNQRPTTYYTEK